MSRITLAHHKYVRCQTYPCVVWLNGCYRCKRNTYFQPEGLGVAVGTRGAWTLKETNMHSTFVAF